MPRSKARVGHNNDKTIIVMIMNKNIKKILTKIKAVGKNPL